MTNLITDTATLNEVCAGFAAHDHVTIDTEFVRETTFWPDLCLVQIASADNAVLIDPLAPGIDLTAMYDLLQNESVLKVFHAARQDMEIFFHESGKLPTPIFDTQVAAMVCGYGDSIAYDGLVNRISGAPIDKTSRFTNWKMRPLTQQQLDYALADVTHLRDVYASLQEQLDAQNRAHWVQEEMAVLTSVETYDLAPENAWTRLKLRVRKPSEFELLKRLAQWREAEARKRNVPRSRVLKDDAIYEIAQQQPGDEQALGRLRTIYKGVEHSAVGKAVLEMVAAVKAMDRDDLPKIPRQRQSPEGTGAAVELLRVLLKLTADENNVAQKVIANGEHLERIAVDGDAANVPAMDGWRRELFGERALKLLRGDTVIAFQDRKITAIDRDPQQS